jgi:hypothetical protein
VGMVQRFLLVFFPPFLPPLRLAAFPAFEIAAARDFGIPLRFRAFYLSLSFTDFPAIRISFEHSLVLSESSITCQLLPVASDLI